MVNLNRINQNNFEKLSEDNKKTLNKFLTRHYEINLANEQGKDPSEMHINIVVSCCIEFLSLLKKPLQGCSNEELITICEDYELLLNTKTKLKTIKQGNETFSVKTNQSLSKQTVKKYIGSLKTFLNFCANNEIIDEAFMLKIKKRKLLKVSWIDKPRYNPLEDINEKERDAIVFSVAKKPFEFAWLSLMRETGARVGELRNLKINFFYHEEGKPYAKITLVGKTGKRTIPILNSVKPIENWLKQHPEASNINAYLFPSFIVDNIRHKLAYNCSKRISNVYFNQRIKKIANDLCITKNVRPHLFRHLKAVECKKNSIPEPVANELLGWSQNSNMYGHYGAMNEEAQLVAIYKLSGIERQDQKEESEQYKVCENCKTINSADKLYCQTCSSELGYTKPKSEIPALIAMNKRLDELEKLNQYALAIADKEISELDKNRYAQLITVLENKLIKS